MKRVSINLLLAAFFTSVGGATIETVETVDQVDLHQYLGKWHEVASIPQSFQKMCVGNTTAEYSFAEGHLLRVLNSCDTQEGTRKLAEGRAKVIDTKSNAKLKVTFVKFIDWIFAFGGDYWILFLGENYSYAVVGDPSREYAWILSRTPVLPYRALVAAEQNLKSNGYNTCRILTSIQKGGFSERKPVCDVVKSPY